jgi:hypothetical protein
LYHSGLRVATLDSPRILFTGLLTFPSTADEVEAALNTLPSIYPQTVSVSRSGSGTNYDYQVTFDNEQGNL